jgi:hypothetical protein
MNPSAGRCCVTLLRNAVAQLLPFMPSKKRKSKFRVEKEARRRARLGIGMPPTERTIADKRRKPPKHKKPFSELAAEV